MVVNVPSGPEENEFRIMESAVRCHTAPSRVRPGTFIFLQRPPMPHCPLVSCSTPGRENWDAVEDTWTECQVIYVPRWENLGLKRNSFFLKVMYRFNVTSAKIQMGLSFWEKSLSVAMLPQSSLRGINKEWMHVLTSALSFQADEIAEDFRSNEVARTKKYKR